jgi:perosamine synthetase
MLSLIPTELWEYSILDAVRAVPAALEARTDFTFPIVGVGPCIPARSARVALVTCLQALSLPKGASVGVPLYCCDVVFQAIKTAGYVPRFIDVEPATFIISAGDLQAKSSEIDAVIVVHAFGNVCDVPALQRIMGKKPVIEDCAQSLGSKLNGRMTGSFGEAAVFSFHSGKYLSVGEGGALFCKTPAVHARASALTSQLDGPSRLGEITHVGKTYVRSLLRRQPLYGVIGRRLWEIYGRRVHGRPNNRFPNSQSYRADLSLARRRLYGLDSAIARQRAIAEFYLQTLVLPKTMLCAEPQDAFYNRYQFPIRFASREDCDSMAARLRARNIDPITPLREIVDVAARWFAYAGDCPISEQLSQSVLVIPSHHDLRRKTADRVARTINDAWIELVSPGARHGLTGAAP